MEDLSFHILDIVENSIRANAKNITIKLTENEQSDLLVVEISDDGEGMNERQLKRALDPFFTTKSGKDVGLGLPFLAQSASEAEGSVDVKSSVGKGTTVTAAFRLSHIDRKPLGNIGETIRCLRATHPDVHIAFEYMIEAG